MIALHTRISVSVLGAALLASCGPTTRQLEQGSSLHRSTTSRVISSEEIAQSGVQNAWEAIRRTGRVSLRENMSGQPTRVSSTRGRSSIVLDDSPIVLVDGVRLVDITLLVQVRANTIDSIEFLNSSEATLRHGTGATGGAIVVVTKSAQAASL